MRATGFGQHKRVAGGRTGGDDVEQQLCFERGWKTGFRRSYGRHSDNKLIHGSGLALCVGDIQMVWEQCDGLSERKADGRADSFRLLSCNS